MVGSVIEDLGSKVGESCGPYPKSSTHHPPAYKTSDAYLLTFKSLTSSPNARPRPQLPSFLFRNQQPVAMETPRVARQTSAVRNIPSINDFNTLTREDMESEFSASPAARPVGIVDRSWSVESAEGPQRCVRYNNRTHLFVCVQTDSMQALFDGPLDKLEVPTRLQTVCRPHVSTQQ